MRQKNNFRYADISSFRDLQTERDMLELKGKLTEAKLKMDVFRIRQVLSLSNFVPALLKDFGLTGLAEVLDRLMSSKETDL
jgi:hypothetical protein